MVAPVTGPFVKEFLSSDQQVYWKRTWSRQKRPYNLQLPYSLSHRQADTILDTHNAGLSLRWWHMEVGPSEHIIAATRDLARERMVKSMHEAKAELSVSIAERKDAVSMITKRAMQFTAFARSVRRLRFADAYKALNLAVPSPRDPSWARLKKRGKDFGGLVTEFQLGWKPLVMDIGSAVEVLQKGIPPVHVKARAQNVVVDRYNTGATAWWDYSARVKVQCSAMVQVDNPNHLLANQLGFVNPATLAWELVPFSFLVDWVVNVSDVLNSMTEFIGLRIFSTSYTINCKIHQAHTTEDYNYNPKRVLIRSGVNTDVWRTVGLPPGPTLRIQPLDRLSLSRGATAMGLLLIALGSTKKS